MKIKSIFKFLFIFIFILFWNLFIVVLQDDEIWNYGFVHNIYSGLIPYKDFNMVITPFYPFIMSLLFHFFGSSLLLLHVENALILTIMCYIIYNLIEEKIYLLGLFVFIFSDSLTFPGYNIFLLFLILLIIYMEKYKYNDYLIGFIIGLSFLTKQSVGIFYLLPSFYFLKVNYKKVFKRFVGFLFPCVIFLIYLLFTNSLNQFLDLCLFGLFDFGKLNTPKFNCDYIFFVTYIIICIFLIWKDSKNINNYYVLAFSSMMLPLFDFRHCGISYILLFIQLLFYYKLKTKIKLWILFFVCIPCMGLVMFKTHYDGYKIVYPNKINHFEYRMIRSDSIKFTDDILGYIKKNNDKDYIFVVSGAYYFRLVTDTKIGYLDLINYGNFGYNGSNKIIKMIKERKKDNSIFIISKYDLNDGCQIDKEVINYIMNNGRKIDSVQVYDFYVLE